MKKILLISAGLVILLTGCGKEVKTTDQDTGYKVKVTPVEVEGGIKNINDVPPGFSE